MAKFPLYDTYIPMCTSYHLSIQSDTHARSIRETPIWSHGRGESRPLDAGRRRSKMSGVSRYTDFSATRFHFCHPSMNILRTLSEVQIACLLLVPLAFSRRQIVIPTSPVGISELYRLGQVNLHCSKISALVPHALNAMPTICFVLVMMIYGL